MEKLFLAGGDKKFAKSAERYFFGNVYKFEKILSLIFNHKIKDQEKKELDTIKDDYRKRHCSQGHHFVSIPPLCNACGTKVKGY